MSAATMSLNATGESRHIAEGNSTLHFEYTGNWSQSHAQCIACGWLLAEFCIYMYIGIIVLCLELQKIEYFINTPYK